MSLIARISICSLAFVVLTSMAFAQQSSEAGAQSPVHKATVGAGTDSGTTTGSSGPSTSSGKSGEPPIPGAELCKSYSGETRRSCLDTVTNPGHAK